MSKLEGTKTEQNLKDAFAGESMARNKYTYYAKAARKEGYEQLAEIFLETAENERSHAKQHAKHLGLIGTTEENLQAGIDGEHYEVTDMYPRMAQEARADGFKEIAKSFELIAQAESAHESRYRALLQRLKDKAVFQRSEPQVWKCRVCGYLHEGKQALKTCPVCGHSQAYFELKDDNY